MAAITHWHLRDDWRELKRSRPGHRFQDRYARARRKEHGSSIAKRVSFMIAGVACLAVGGFFAVMPGPAIPFFFLAGGLLAAESLLLARFMDWSELKVRRATKWGKQRWRRLPLAARVVVVMVAVACSLGGAYLSYRFFSD